MIDRERARDGRFVEIVGHYNPRRTPPEIVLKRERVDYWIGQGAQPSETVQSFLKKLPAAGASTGPSGLSDEAGPCANRGTRTSCGYVFSYTLIPANVCTSAQVRGRAR